MLLSDMARRAVARLTANADHWDAQARDADILAMTSKVRRHREAEFARRDECVAARDRCTARGERIAVRFGITD